MQNYILFVNVCCIVTCFINKNDFNMKTIFTGLFLILFFGVNFLNAQHLEKVWQTTADLKTPESVLYDQERDVIYVSNINGDPAQKDGNGFISILNPDGSVKNLEWIKNLNAPKGLAIFKAKLYVADIDQLVEIDIEKGTITAKYNAPGAVFLNDVTANMDGKIFVSDTRTAKIHVLDKNKFTVWIEGKPFENPNGLMAEKGKLLVGDNNIYEVDIQTKKINTLIKDAGGVDGLEKNREGDFVFSNWPGKIFIQKNGETIKLLDTTEQKMNTADIDYDLKHDLVLVPTFFDNHIVAYKIVF
jgi:DNA-binding beta-propeller fold protein YncE